MNQPWRAPAPFVRGERCFSFLSRVKRVNGEALRNKEKACQTLELKIGVKPTSAELILLPIWSLKVQHKTKKAKRTINMDAATGRLFTGSL